MPSKEITADAIVIGAGFVGVRAAIELRGSGYSKVIVLEKESLPFSRASTYNQFRIHRGYHYPRSLETARQSALSYQKFIEEYEPAIIKGTNSYYAVAGDSKVNAKAFTRHCAEVGIPLVDATRSQKDHFNLEMIEAVFEVEESFFNPNVVGTILAEEAAQLGIEIICNTKVLEVIDHPNYLTVKAENLKASADVVVNASYAGINHIDGYVPSFSNEIKYQVAEITHVKAAPNYKNQAFTIVDGPYMSLTPRYNTKYHNLSHVTLTPREELFDTGAGEALEIGRYHSRAKDMIREATKYMPGLGTAHPTGSHYEVKAILTENSSDDGRPMTLKSLDNRSFSILGGKIDVISTGLSILSDRLRDSGRL